jgi:MFS family permease
MLSLTPRQVRLGLAASFASTFCSLTGLFMFLPLLTFTFKAMGLSDAMVGLAASAEWLGLAIGTPFVARWVSMLGMQRAFVASGLVPFLSILFITITPWPGLWVVLILLGGISGSMRWIVAESTVSQLAPNHLRGRIVGLYGTMISLTYVLGPGLLAWIGTQGEAGNLARWTAVVLSAVGLMISNWVPHMEENSDKTQAPARLGLGGILDAMRSAPLLLITGALGGFFEAGSTGILPLFGLAIGLGEAKSAVLLVACGLGGVLVMAPVGAMADRWPHQKIYVACTLVTALASVMMAFVGSWPLLSYVIAFIWGATGGVLYTLAMVDIGNIGRGVHLVNLTSVLVLSYTVGGTLGPMLGGFALTLDTRWGVPALMTLAALAGLRAYTYTRPTLPPQA